MSIGTSERTVMDNVKETRELLRIVGHKISTPLTDILQIADGITYGVEGEVSRSVREEVLKMRASAEQVLSITERILALISIESLREDTATVNIREAIHYVYNLMLPMANAHNRQLILDLPLSLPPVKANGNILQQALQTICANAINLAHSSTILVSTTWEPNFVITSIQDGLSSNTQQRLSIGEFLRMTPLAELSLDLLLCRRIAEIAHGDFWLNGDVELGNIGWYISWPIAENIPFRS